MSTYPIHVFVAPDGTWFSADKTDQAHVSLEKAKRVRTRTIRLPGCVETVDGDLLDIEGREVVTILVSAGLWAPSQLGYAPFAEAVAEAAEEARKISQRGGFTYRDVDPWMSRAECTEGQGRACGGRPLSHVMRRALWHAVKGYSVTAALRVAGRATHFTKYGATRRWPGDAHAARATSAMRTFPAVAGVALAHLLDQPLADYSCLDPVGQLRGEVLRPPVEALGSDPDRARKRGLRSKDVDRRGFCDRRKFHVG